MRRVNEKSLDAVASEYMTFCKWRCSRELMPACGTVRDGREGERERVNNFKNACAAVERCTRMSSEKTWFQHITARRNNANGTWSEIRMICQCLRNSMDSTRTSIYFYLHRNVLCLYLLSFPFFCVQAVWMISSRIGCWETYSFRTTTWRRDFVWFRRFTEIPVWNIAI